MSDQLDKARAYVAKVAHANQGGRNDALNRLAYALIQNFSLSETDFEALCLDWASGCCPPISDKEAAQTIRSAWNGANRNGVAGAKVRKHTYRGDARQAEAPRTFTPRPPTIAPPLKPSKAYTMDATTELPAPQADATRTLLKAAFQAGEHVRIAPATLAEDGKEIPDGAGTTLPLETWLAKLDERDGDVNRIFKSSKRTGLYVGVNPGGSKDGDVTAYRHALIEFDEIPIAQQWQLIVKSEIPCTAVIHSGGKSVHAWVRVDARDRQDYESRVRLLLDHFSKYRVDEKNKNPSRLSRLPGCERFEARQELLALNIGAETFDDWASTVGKGLPAIEDAADLIARVGKGEIILPDVIVEGVLHRGHKLALGGGSKTNKTWCLLDLAVSVAAGADWLGFRCMQGRTFYLNFEIDPAHFAHRLKRVTDAKGLTMKPDALSIWTLRGHSAAYHEIIPTLINAVKGGGYTLGVIDPLYKMLGGADENKATDIAQLLNHLESLALHTGASIAFGAHFSKGDQSQKSSIDRISGSGVFARDPDSILTLTPHEQEHCFSVDFTLRNFAYQEPFVVTWDYPLMRKTDLNPRALKKQQAKEPKYKPAQLIELITKPLRFFELEKLAHAKWGMSTSTLNKMLGRLVDAGEVEKYDDGEEVTRYRRPTPKTETTDEIEPF